MAYTIEYKIARYKEANELVERLSVAVHKCLAELDAMEAEEAAQMTDIAA